VSEHQDEIAQIRGLIHLLEHAPLEKKWQRSHEVLGRIRKLLSLMESHHQQRLRRVSQSLAVLLKLLRDGSVIVDSVESHEAFNWARDELEKFLHDVEEDLDL
jgi:hypothetical protein